MGKLPSDTQHTIGKILDWPMERDAIHIAVLSAVAGEMLVSGAPVCLEADGLPTARMARHSESVGIVDPFLPRAANAGQRFWVFLHPNSVTGMRHHWSHPVVDSLPVAQRLLGLDKGKAAEWLKNFSDEYGFDYHQMIESAKEHRGRIVAGSDLDYGAVQSELETFWKNMEILTGQKFSAVHRDSVSFSCAC